ncbi:MULTISPECIES: sigma-54-dependent Fis family transcriptional regulator [Lacticaseibacillus]|uniref:PrpR N-terminal domain-containing protein n=2 Tax=Lacticaseibacillus TaxID=2759736 RepID=A0AAN1KFD5_LACCA|nr:MULTISPECIES: sigma-54-dependent Fis family transcriptional regulator [Lacticaseibacillus]ARY92695.1 transcriptional regulator [Lacticaseibacillus casei]KAB1969464.1 sigma-54-dependent transcriptional regulator [Lacticaseibacillus casei]WLV80596.1 PrpR N-terminal domain-containing protein [Lacticaseibacillus sp. NCIMB 15473]WNX24556.1 PrpR N-terminal domain-containing protein [Lacticaseibacillus casei]WNX27328.1 PrpR N-terminal domain-containing protein [Lacticaseibacillus casei]
MLKVLAIAPYPNLKNKMDEIAQKFKTLYIESYVGDLTEGLEIAQKKSANFDVIVSRGGTAKLIRENLDKPLIEIDLSLLDILRVIRLVEVYKYNYAFIGFSNVTDKIKILGQILEKELHIVTISKSAELPNIIKQLKAQDYSMIIGDNITFKEARKSNLNSILIESGDESIYNAFSSARYLGTELKKVDDRNRAVVNALSAFDQSVLVLDQNCHLQSQHHNGLLKAHEQAILHTIKPQVLSGSTKAFTLFSRVEEQLYQINARFRNRLWYVLVTPLKSLVDNDSSIKSFVPASNQDVSSVNIGNLSKDVQLAAKSGRNVLFIGEKGTAKLTAAEHLASMIQANHYWKIDLNKMKSESAFWALFNNATSPLLDHHALFIISGVEKLNALYLKTLQSFCDMSETTDNHFLLIYRSGSHQNSVASRFHTTFQITTTPLRKRKADIGSLVSLYLYQFSKRYQKSVVGISEDGMTILESYSWPENLFQFKRVLEQLVLQTNGPFISSNSVKRMILNEEAQFAYHQTQRSDLSNISMFKGETLAKIEKQICTILLKQNADNRTKTAKELGISRSTLWRILK